MPTQIDQKLRRIPENEVVVACGRKIPTSVPADGGYGHLGMPTTDDTPSFPERVTPPPGDFQHEIVNQGDNTCHC